LLVTLENGFEFHVFSYRELYNAVRIQRDERFIEQAGFVANLETCPDVLDDTPCMFFLTDRKEQVVSQIKAFPDRLCYRNEEFPMVWTGNLFTVPELREQGLGKYLMKMRREYLGMRRILRASTFSTEIALNMLRQNADAVLGYLPRYILPNSLRPFVGNHMAGIPAKATKALMSALLSAMLKLKHLRPGYSAVEIDSLNAGIEWEEIFSARRYNHVCHFNDRLDKLLWKIGCSNGKEHNRTTLQVLLNKTGKDPVAYAVIRESSKQPQWKRRTQPGRIMTVTDCGLLKHSTDGPAHLVHFLMSRFLHSTADVLEVFPNSHGMKQMLRTWGMFRAGKGMSFSITIPAEPEFKNLPLALDSWCLTPFCGDGFTF
jgi:hypothetical protein